MSTYLPCLMIVTIALASGSCASTQQQDGYEYNQYVEDNFGNANYGATGNYNELEGEVYENGVSQNDDSYGNYSQSQYNNEGNDYAGYGNSDYGYGAGEDINNFNEYNDANNLLAGADINNSALVENYTEQGPTVVDEADQLAQEPVQDTSLGQQAITPTGEVQSPSPNSDYSSEYDYAEADSATEETLTTSGEVVQAPVENLPDVLPLTSEVWWVGYDYNRRLRLLKIQMLTKGMPSFDFIQERNQNGQPELVVRFYGANLRKKIRRDIDASEFSSPVAYVRMREDPATNTVDVVLTLREEVRPLMYAKNGNVQLTFPLTSKYLGGSTQTEVVSYDAESLQNAQVLPEIIVGSDMPKSSKLAKAYIPDPVGKVFEVSPNTGARNVLPTPADEVETRVDDQGLPIESFNEDPALEAGAEVIEETEQNAEPAGEVLPSAPLDDSNYEDTPEMLNDSELDDEADDLEFPDEVHHVTEFSWLGVAQDDFSLDSELTGGAAAAGGSYGDSGGAALPVETNEGQLDFNNVQGVGNPASDLDLTNDSFEQDAASAKPVQAETLTMDDLGSATAVADIVGSDSEIIEEGFTGKPVVLEFYEAPLGQVLKAFADQIGTNFIYPPALGATQVSIKLKDVPWDAALNALLETNGLGMARISDNIVRIDRLANMTRYIADRQEAKNIKMLSQPAKILVIRLSNVDAGDIQKQITEFIPDTIRRNVNFSSDPQTNTLYIEAPPAILARVKSLVDRLDVPVPQVEIVSRLIEVARQAQNFLGVSWAGAFNYDANRGLGFGTLNIPNSFGSTYSVDPGVNNTSAVGSSTFNIGSINNLIDLNLRLKMEEAKGTAEILQSSRLMVKDRQAANISAGTLAYMRTLATVQEGQVVNQQAAGGGSGGGGGGAVTQISIQLSLNVTPRVTNDGHVEMQIALTSQAPAASGLPGTALAVNSRNIKTLLRKKSGETAVIGGIYDTKKVEQESGIPFFSSLPIIGALFRSKTTSQSQTEMMMLITPRIQTEVEDAVAAGEAAPATYQGGGNIPLNNGYSGNNYGNYGNGNNYGNYENYGNSGASDVAAGNYGGSNYDGNYSGNNYSGNNYSGNNYGGNNYGGNNYGGNNYGGNNYGDNNYGGNNYGGNNYGNGNLMENVNQSNTEYNNNYGNY